MVSGFIGGAVEVEGSGPRVNSMKSPLLYTLVEPLALQYLASIEVLVDW